MYHADYDIRDTDSKRDERTKNESLGFFRAEDCEGLFCMRIPLILVIASDISFRRAERISQFAGRILVR